MKTQNLKLRTQNLRLIASSLAFLIGIALSGSVAFAREWEEIPTGWKQTESQSDRNAAENALEAGQKLFQQRTAESLRQAIAQFKIALQLYRQLGNTEGEAFALLLLGEAYSDFGDIRQALDSYNQALPLRKQAEDNAGEAYLLYSIGRMRWLLAENRQALDYYNRALPLFLELHDEARQAAILTSMGLVSSELGKKQIALDYHQQALSLIRSLGNDRERATILNNIGTTYDDWGEPQEALDYYDRSFALYRQVGNSVGIATTLNNMGVVFWSLGESQKAIDSYNQSLPIWEEFGDRRSQAKTLNNIGNVYWSLGDSERSLDYYKRALDLRRSTGDDIGEALTLNNIGNVYRALQDNERALDYYNRALGIGQGLGDSSTETLRERAGVANILHNMGKAYSNLGSWERALDYFQKALAIDRSKGDPRGAAYTLANIGQVHFQLGALELAGDYYNEALPLARKTGDAAWEANILYSIAKLKDKQGKPAEALAEMEAALEIIENLRVKVSSSELRTTYFASVQDYYEFYIDLLMRLHQEKPDRGYNAKALEASERARARSLLDILAEAGADLRAGADSELLERERVLQQQINAKAQRQIELASSPGKEERSASIQRELQDLLGQSQEIRAQIRSASPRYAAIAHPEPLSVAQLQQQVLDGDTLLLEYYLGKERSYLWLVTQTEISSYQLPGREEIDKAALNFRNYLTAPSLRIRRKQAARVSQKLSNLILAPVAAQLDNKRLLIVADGALQYIPFAALPLPEPGSDAQDSLELTPLIVEHEIINLPSASTLAILRREMGDRSPASRALAIFADPVFSPKDERLGAEEKSISSHLQCSNQCKPILGEAYGQKLLPLALGYPSHASPLQNSKLKTQNSKLPTWSRLPGTRQEARAILDLFSTSESQAVFDFEATRSRATSPELSQYRIVHFATHGFANAPEPELSGIVMSLVDENGREQNGYLRLHEIYNLNLSAELVVISACQTGLGKQIRGEGVISLTRGFMHAGANRVVVSLWSVDDAATAEFMSIFYRQMLLENLAPAAALRAAQIQMWQQKQWQLPYYWAAFGLQGEWR